MRSRGSALAGGAALRDALAASFLLAQGALALAYRGAAGRPEVHRCGPPASGLPWWTPVAVSAALLLVALAYVLRHRRRSTPDPGAPLPGEDPAVKPPFEPLGPPDPPRFGSETFARLSS